jgi:CDP-diacylglycerol--serine O-phosphatidyltransferase
MRVDLRKTLFILPNLFTLSSIFCGFYAMLVCTTPSVPLPGASAIPSGGEVSPEAFYKASILIVFAMFFDTIDGRVARLTKTQSAFGVQIDSLADVVSFGAAPAVLLYRWSLHQLGVLGLVVSFVFLGCGAIRLARFNVLAMGAGGAPKKPSKFILGLPIPGAAGIVVALVVANWFLNIPSVRLDLHPEIVLAIVLVLSFFMVSTIKFRSFKNVKLSVGSVIFVLGAVGSTIAMMMMFHWSVALVWLLAGYVTLGVIEAVLDLSRVATGRPRRLVDDSTDSQPLGPASPADEPARISRP